MKGKRLFVVALSMLVWLTAFAGCSQTGGMREIAWSDGVNAEGRYDNSLFYSNDFESVSVAPDPYIYYDDDGWFYLYSTEVTGGVLLGYRSRNLANWEYLGPIFQRSSSYWASGLFWAPKVVKNPADGKYYLYTSCAGTTQIGLPEGTSLSSSSEVFAKQTEDRLHLTVLVADSPAGPFHEWTGKRQIQKFYHGEPQLNPDKNDQNLWDDEVTLTSGPIFDFANAPAAWETNKEHFERNGTNVFAQLDAYPFFDDDGTFYLYFVRSIDMNDRIGKHGVWGVKMLDMVTPDFTTLTQLTQPGYLTPGGDRSPNSIDNTAVNEGPCVRRHTTKKADGTTVSKYYLTYSRSGYGDPRYSACLALADSPLGYAKGSEEAANGGFVKLDSKYGNPMHMISNHDMYNATGNAMYFAAGGEEFLVSLATVYNNTNPAATSRNFIIDRIVWDYNEELGYDIPHSNGPTQASLQPAPYVFSGYKNIACEANVTATNMREGSSEKFLNDGYVTIHARDEEKDFYSTGETEITLTFSSPRAVRAVMVYNSFNIDFAFKKIDSVLLEGEDGTYVIRDVAFPEKHLTGAVDMGGEIRPGAAAVAEFEELQVKRIRIKISEKISDIGEFIGEYAGIGITEIRVLGK